MGKDAVGKKQVNDMIRLRSGGHTINETAWSLGLYPWHVAYLTRMIKTCVSAEELDYMVEQADHHGFGTVGELMMDVFNRCYEEDYPKRLKKKIRKAG